MTARYYAQSTEVNPIFLSSHGNGWQVFDRDLLSRQGEVLPIAFCISRDHAFTIRDALNKGAE